MSLRVWSSVGKQLVPLSSRVPGFLSWYACGPTVYDDSHIGHASSYVRQDVVRRIVEGLGGVQVLQLMGVTDIDDKIIRKSQNAGVGWETISRKYELEFFEDLQSLGVQLPNVKTRVTEFIPNIIQFVGELVKGGWAYSTQDGSVYFETRKYEGYGKLRKISISNENEIVAEEGQGKRSPQDFAVWKGWKAGEPYWNTPWGKGRPGWHIECSVMASHFFGNSLDIHSGGVDLIFPHHENEEAQCCTRFGVNDWVKHWIHTGHLNVRGDVKMSKSLGNVITIRDFLNNNSADSFRMFCILTKYRNGLEYSEDSLHHAHSILRKFESYLSDTQAILSSSKTVTQSSQIDLWDKLVTTREKILTVLKTDFDTAVAINELSEYVDSFNRAFSISSSSPGTIDFGMVLASRQLIENFLSLTGFTLGKEKSSSDKVRVETLLEELTRFRGTVRNYALAADEDKSLRKEKISERKPLLSACDEVRENLIGMGFDIKDFGKSSSSSLAAARESGKS